MAKNNDWSDYFSDSYSKASDRASQIAYERQKQQELSAQQAFENQLAVSKFALDQKKFDAMANGSGMPVFTVGSDGNLQQVGAVPKGSRVLTPSAMMTPQEKANIQVDTAAKTDLAVRDKKLAGLMQAVDFFDKKISELPIGSGMQGRVEGIGQQLSGWLQTNPKAAAYMANIQGMRSQIARGLGEVGNLSVYEQKYAVNLLPKLTDNAETRAAKLQNFRDYINQRLGGNASQLKSTYIKTGTNSKGQRVGMKSDGTIEVIK